MRAELDKKYGTMGNRLLLLSTAPENFWTSSYIWAIMHADPRDAATARLGPRQH